MEGTGSVLQCNTETKVRFSICNANYYQQLAEVSISFSYTAHCFNSHCPHNSELPYASVYAFCSWRMCFEA